jgi:hypothetical protein
MHGGLQEGDKRLKHGRYSVVKHETLRELATHHEADPDPLNILPELAHARAIYTNFVNDYDIVTRALVDWHSGRWLNPEQQEALYACLNEFEDIKRVGFMKVGKEKVAVELSDRQIETLGLARAAVEHLGEIPGDRPTKVLDIADAYRIISEITKIVERIEKIRAANAISRPELNRIMNEMGRAVATFVDPAVAQKIKEAWLELIRV